MFKLLPKDAEGALIESTRKLSEVIDQRDAMQAELTELRAFKAACEKQEAVLTEEMFDCVLQESELSFKRHCRSIRGQMITVLDMPDYHVASAALRLFGLADPEAAQLRMRLANAMDWIEAQNEVIAELNKELAERDQQVAEACAAECEGIDAINSRGWGDFLAKRIRSGEWKKHMKGVE